MDKKQLIEIIRKVVRQEVKKTIKEIFTNKEDVQESFDLKSLVKTKPKKQQPKKQKGFTKCLIDSESCWY